MRQGTLSTRKLALAGEKVESGAGKTQSGSGQEI